MWSTPNAFNVCYMNLSYPGQLTHLFYTRNKL